MNLNNKEVNNANNVHIKNALAIRGLALSVQLGVTHEEQQIPQIILLNVDIYFIETLRACQTDKLSDALCYSHLITQIQNYILDKQFHLIEFLTYEIYSLIKTLIPFDHKIKVRVIKQPKIKGLTGDVSFSYQDDLATW